MRITNSMMMHATAAGLQKKTQLILNLSEKVSTGKRILRPSDDPLGMAKAMNYRETISRVDQYMENISRGKSKIEISENILEEVENLVMSAKQIATDQSMGVLETRSTAAEQVKTIFDQVMNLANSEFENKYLFSGHRSDTVPFTRNADGIDGTPDDYEVVYHGDDGDQKIIIGKNNHVTVSSSGDEVFANVSVGGVNVFDILNDLIGGMENANVDEGTDQIRTQAGLLGTAQEQVNTARTKNAGIYSQLQSSQAYWEKFKVGMEDQLSNVEDVDMTQSVVDLQNAQLVYETNVAVSKEILQSSLLAFLK